MREKKECARKARKPARRPRAYNTASNPYLGVRRCLLEMKEETYQGERSSYPATCPRCWATGVCSEGLTEDDVRVRRR